MQLADIDRLRREASLLALLPQDAAVRHSGKDRWLARCQFHEDRTPSMLVSLTDAGWLYFCYGCGAKGDVIRFVQDTRKMPFLDACRALGSGALPPPRNDRVLSTKGEAPRARKDGEPWKIVATYDYFDEGGVLIYQVVRLDPKSFRQRQPREFGGWKWTMQGARRVLYRLPELLAADPARPVYVVEGEKDADALAATGRIVTTNVGGAGKWLESYNESLRGRRVIVLPDNDKPGRDHATVVKYMLTGIAANVDIVNLPGLPPKGDVSDWLKMKGEKECK